MIYVEIIYIADFAREIRIKMGPIRVLNVVNRIEKIHIFAWMVLMYVRKDED